MTLRKSWSTPQWKYQSLSDHSVFTQKLKNQSRFVVLKSSFWATEIFHLANWDGTGELLTRYTGFDDPVTGGVCWTPSSTSALQQTSKLGLVAETENEGRTPGRCFTVWFQNDFRREVWRKFWLIMAFHSTLELSEEALILIRVERLLSESVFNYNQTYACF